jgi:DNA mismatch repair protein MutS
MGIYEDYFELTNYYTNKYGEYSVVLIQVGAFFEVYGVMNTIRQEIIENPAAYKVSQICDLKLATKQATLGKDRTLHMLGFRDYQLDKYIEKLVNEGYTVIVYKQDEQTSGTTRSLLGVYSAGTFCGQSDGFSSTEEVHTNQKLSNHITCLSIFLPRSVVSRTPRIQFGLASVDVFTGQSNLCEYQREYKNDSTTYDDVERYMSMNQPQEVIICYPISLHRHIQDIIDFIGLDNCKRIHTIPIGKPPTQSSPEISKMIVFTDTMSQWSSAFTKCEKQTYQEEIIKKFYKNCQDVEYFMNSLQLYEHPNATHSFLFLLEFIYSQNPEIIHKITEPIIYTEHQELILANHSLRQLNIIDDHHILETRTKSNLSSVSRFINRCITAMGKRKQYTHIIRPTRNTTWLQRQYEITADMMSHIHRRNDLSGIADLEKIYRKITMRKLPIQDLSLLYKNIIQIGEILETETDQMKTYITKEKEIPFSEFELAYSNIRKIIETQINTSILDSDIDDKNIFNASAYPFLDELYKKAFCSRHIIEAICREFNNILTKFEKKDADYCKLYETAKSAPYIRMTKRRYAILKEQLKKTIKIPYGENQSYILDAEKIESTVISGTVKTADIRLKSPQLDDLLSSVAEDKDAFLKEMDSTYLEFIDILREHQKEFELISFYIMSLDVVLNRCYIANEYKYSAPTIIENNVIRAYDLRHVLIEHIQQSEAYVPNDVVLGDDKDSILLYGTNASGKSSLIKALGISLVMAQSGFYVACSRFEYTPFKYIFTRILGNDNIFKNLSTYAVEMSEFRTILKYADAQSLVLGDELCSGTEIGSALSIFSAGLIQLHQRKTKCIFATHFHQLTDYERITSLSRLCFKHLKVDIDEHENLYYDRKMYDGAGNNMYGLIVCRSLGMPKDFLDLANEIRLELNPEQNTLTQKKTSRYNKKKITNACELCGKPATETHHLLPQQLADTTGYIQTSSITIHKNHKANLMSICEECHQSLHKDICGNIIGHKRVKTTAVKKLETVEFDNMLEVHKHSSQ